ncbi:uncharacterized protein [Diabrotica undecimpunctata]|uniref:uncharacterized protein isoform X2 n=1 Tax=Diabrotica undecimpunctata TaxID=50387 RepID=UPI003B637DBE
MVMEFVHICTSSISTLESDDDTRSQRSRKHSEDNVSQLSMQHSEYNITSPSPSVNSLSNSLPPIPSISLDPSTLSRKRKDDHTTRMFSLISQRLSEKEDEFDVFGKNVSNKLRTMTAQQQILAQKLINDVIFCGQMEQLSLNSQISVQHAISTNPHTTTSSHQVSNTQQFQPEASNSMK